MLMISELSRPVEALCSERSHVEYGTKGSAVPLVALVTFVAFVAFVALDKLHTRVSVALNEEFGAKRASSMTPRAS